jgi:hypothetical protein
MSSKNQKAEEAKTIILGSAKQVELKKAIANVPETITGGLGSIVQDQLVSDEIKRLTEKVKEIGLDGYRTIGDLTSKFYAIEKGDIVSYVPSDENSLECIENRAFSPERAKLRPKVKEANDALVKAYDEAMTANTETAFVALASKIKEAKKVIEEVKSHLANSKNAK